MKIEAVLTLDGVHETIIEGDAPLFDGATEDALEQKGIGFWVSHYLFNGHPHAGQVFCPWGSVLMVETARMSTMAGATRISGTEEG